MITLEHLKIYQHYGKDIDALARWGTDEEKKVLKDETWWLFEELLQGLTLIKNGYASTSYAEAVERKLNEHCDGIETITRLKKLVDS